MGGQLNRLAGELLSIIGNERGFIHKKLLGVVGKVAGVIPLPGAGIIGTIARKLSRKKARKERATASKFDVTTGRQAGAIPATFGPLGTDCPPNFKWNSALQLCFPPRGITGGGRPPCDFPMVRDSAGNCRKPTSGEFGGEQFGVGAAVMGRYGAALEPGSQIVDRAICLKGMQLGDDGLCYNKSQISNKQRMWPAGRKPLLSGGDMAAIQKAARAARRLEGTTKRLQRMGMMKKPTPRRLPPHQHARAARDVVSV